MQYNILDIDWINSLPDELDKILRSLNNEIIGTICKKIKTVGGLSPTDAKKIQSATEYIGMDFNKLKKIVAAATNKSVDEIEQIFEKAASENANFANVFYEYRGMERIKTENLKRFITAYKKAAVDSVKNLSHTLGFIDKNGRPRTVRNEYIRCVDRAISAVRMGVDSYDIEVRRIVRELTNSEVRVIDFESNYHRRVDSQVRMNVLDGVRQMNMAIQEQVGQEFGADGVETTMHALEAPDHQPYSGRQYSLEEWEKINAKLDRPWGTLNCQHGLYYIILGVNKPVYSEQERQELYEKSNEVITYDGKEMSRYKASQVMRAYETRLRDINAKISGAKNAGSTDELRKAQKQKRDMTAKYNAVAKAAGLSKRMGRTK